FLVSDKDVEAIKLVNAVAAAYLKEIVEEEHAGRGQRKNQLLELQRRYTDLLKAKRGALSDLVEAAGTSDLGVMALKQKNALEQLSLTQRELFNIKSDARKLELDLDLNEQGKTAAKVAVSESM